MEAEVRRHFSVLCDVTKSKVGYKEDKFVYELKGYVESNELIFYAVYKSFCNSYNDYLEKIFHSKRFRVLKGYENKCEGLRNINNARVELAKAEMESCKLKVQEVYYEMLVRSQYLDIPCPIKSFVFPSVDHS